MHSHIVNHLAEELREHGHASFQNMIEFRVIPNDKHRLDVSLDYRIKQVIGGYRSQLVWKGIEGRIIGHYVDKIIKQIKENQSAELPGVGTLIWNSQFRVMSLVISDSFYQKLYGDNSD